MKRRNFIALSATALGGVIAPFRMRGATSLADNNATAVGRIIARSSRGSSPRILLRSSWQSIDTGDVAHTPGALRLIERHVPGAEVTLWPSPGKFSPATRAMLLRNFPKLRIAEGDTDSAGKPTTPDLAAAWEADFFLHSSGSSLVGRAHLAAWRKATGRPYGIYSITVDPVSFFTGGQNIEGGALAALQRELESPEVRPLTGELRQIFDEASFVYCRDTLSLGYLRQQKVKTPVLGFGPDTAFSWDIKNLEQADRWLSQVGLQAGQFLTIVPRLRYTPYHLEYKLEPTAGDLRKKVVSDRWVDADTGKLREVVTRWVRETGMKVALIPEFPYEMDVCRDWIFAKLPADIRASVAVRDTFWSPDEQSGVMSRARVAVSLECHSPMLALAHGVPTIYLRQPTDTIKGQMWRDLKYGDWFADIDEVAADDVWQRVKNVHQHHAAAVARAQAFMRDTRALQDKLWGQGAIRT